LAADESFSSAADLLHPSVTLHSAENQIAKNTAIDVGYAGIVREAALSEPLRRAASNPAMAFGLCYKSVCV
jgi:hypothetical protein